VRVFAVLYPLKVALKTCSSCLEAFEPQSLFHFLVDFFITKVLVPSNQPPCAGGGDISSSLHVRVLSMSLMSMEVGTII